MKKMIVSLAVFLFCAVFLLSGCDKEPAWQEFYDAGIQASEEENYEEAIVAFEEAIALDASRPEAYAALADVYLAKEDLEQALEVLQRGVEATNNETLKARIEEITVKLEELAGTLEEEQLKFIQSVLCAVNYESFVDSNRELEGDDLFFYINNMLNSSYIYFDIDDVLPKHETNKGVGGTYYSLSEEEVNQATKEIFGVSFQRDTNLSNLAIGPNGGWNFEMSAFLFPVAVGRGKYAEVILNDYHLEDNLLKVSYTFNRYETAESSANRQPTSSNKGAAIFQANSASCQYPYQIVSNGKSFASIETVTSSPLVLKLINGIWLDFRGQDLLYTKYRFKSDFTGTRTSYTIDTGEQIGDELSFTYKVNEEKNSVSITTTDTEMSVTSVYQHDGQDLSTSVSYSDEQIGNVFYTFTIYYYEKMPTSDAMESKWLAVNTGG